MSAIYYHDPTLSSQHAQLNARNSPPPPTPSIKYQSDCPECGLEAGKTCALCSACGCAFHPGCLEPPLKHRPTGSSPVGLGKADWICFHCVCAQPVSIAAGEDDPALMAALEWSGEFEPPSEGEVRAFWAKEHGDAMAEQEEKAAREKKKKGDEYRMAKELAEIAVDKMVGFLYIFCVCVCVF